MIRLAIIGMGRISVNHLLAVKNNRDQIELAAICDLEEAHMAKALEKADFTEEVHTYTDYRKLLENEKIDMVSIATDSGKHAEIALDCIEKGCHVLIEKPIAMGMDDAEKLIEKAQEKGVKLGACHQNRFNKSVQILRKALEKGNFGQISHIAAHVRWNRDKDYYDQAPWRGKWKSDGGCLMNQCIHNADLMYWMLGDIEEVFAYTAQCQHPYMESEDLGLALIKGKNGQYGLFEGTVNVYPSNLEETLYVFGEKGTVKVGGKSVNIIEKWEFLENTDISEEELRDSNEIPPNIYGYGHTRLYADFIDSILKDRKPLVDGMEAKRALELILAMYQSKKMGQPVRLPIGKFDAIDMKGTF